MTRRTAVAALMGALCIAAIAETASAFTRREAICVRGARSRAKAAVSDARDKARTQLSTDLSACFGDGSGCVGNCLSEQARNQKGPNDAIKACQVDICKQQSLEQTDACRDAADPVACVAQAQLTLFLCNQQCVAQHEADLIEANGVFNDCLQGCSNP
jgi:hypothetical protein